MKIDLERATWLKSRHSGGSGGNCVEISKTFAEAGVVLIRDSKNPIGPVLSVSAVAFARFAEWAASFEA
jgi:hypothetical protein